MIATTIAVLAFLGALLAVVECVAMIKRFEDLHQRINHIEWLLKKKKEYDRDDFGI